MDVNINTIAVIVAAIASMVVGSIWYAKPVFGKQWQKLVGLNDRQIKEGSIKAIAGACVLALISAYVLAHIIELSHNFYNYSYLQTGITSAFWLWLGIAMPTILTHALFEQRNKTLTLLAATDQLVSLLIMGIVIGLFGH